MALYDQYDEDEKFKQMLGGIIGSGPSPWESDVGNPEPTGLSAPVMPGASGGMGGYTPPPAASAPQYLDHVEGHQFGPADIAMLGGIVAALGLGGRHRGDIAGSLAGQYGGAVMQANARADTRNQQVDQFNAQLAAKDDPLARWKADQQAQYQAGSLKARGDELALQKSREDRIAAAQDAEDAKDPVEQARLVAEARSKVDLDNQRQHDDMEAGLKTKLAEILGVKNGRLQAPGAADTTGPAAPTTDPVKLLKQKQAQAALDGITDGSVDPLTGKSKIAPEKPKPAKADMLPFADTEYEDDAGKELFAERNSTAGNRQKNSDTDAELSKGIAALKTMRDLIRDNGSQWGESQDSTKIKGEFETARGVVQSAQAKLRNLGVLQEGERKMVDEAIGADITPGMSDLTSKIGLGDLRIGRLEGTIKSLEEMQAFNRHANGVRAKSKEAPGPEKDLGTSPSGKVSFSVDTKALDKFNAGDSGGGTRTVTVTYTDGETESFTGTDEQINKLRGKSAVRSVQ